MPKQAFHHGNLRVELLDLAETVLRERGAVKLSLRELAREAGVSHGAPRSHFPDRDALLNALAERGFDRLAHAIGSVIREPRSECGAASDLLRAAGRAYMDFAAQNPALLALMVTAKSDGPTGLIHEAAARLFATMTALVTTALGLYGNDAKVESLTLVLSATVQGISSLVISGRVTAAQGDILLGEAIRVFVAGASSEPRFDTAE
jgi:AcrR family transcriptional regulator